MEVVNSDIEEGEQPVVQSRYSIVIATAKRARQIIDGEEPLVNGFGKKPLSVAVEELYKGKVKIVGSVDDDDDDDVRDYNNDVLDLGLGDDVDEEKLFDEDDDHDHDEDEDEDDAHDDDDDDGYDDED